MTGSARAEIVTAFIESPKSPRGIGRPRPASRLIKAELGLGVPGGRDEDADEKRHRKARDERREDAPRPRDCPESDGFGLSAILETSDGRGGFHLWIPFSEPIPGDEARAFAIAVSSDHLAFGILEVECFPKQPRVRQGGVANSLRLPGLHHTNGNWSQVFDGERWHDGAASPNWTVDASPYRPAPPRGRNSYVPKRISIPASRPKCETWEPLEMRLEKGRRWLSDRSPAIERRGGEQHTFDTCREFLREFRLTPAEAFPLLSEWNHRCEPPWPAEELLYKLERAPRYLPPPPPPPALVREEPVSHPGADPDLWIPVETSPEVVTPEIAAIRSRLIAERKDSMNRPGLYLDRSPPGVGKTAACLQLIKEENRTTLIAARDHASCLELLNEARDVYALNARSFPRRSTEEYAVVRQFCGDDPPGRRDPNCTRCDGKGVLYDYMSCRNETADVAEQAGPTA